MINIKRSKIIPQSLDNQEIKDYIHQAVCYLQDSTLSKPEKPISYRNSDLLEAFDDDFYSKCYLTEQKFTNSWIMDIEHFIPQHERPDLVYEWENLFPAEHYTNMIKPRNTPIGGYLNPCHDDVENEIIYTLSFHGEDPDFSPKNPTNCKAVNTCSLLNRVHNGHDKSTKKATASLRHAIRRKYTDILLKIIAYQRHTEDSQEKAQLLRELKDLVSKNASFTMLCRSIPALRQLPVNLFD